MHFSHDFKLKSKVAEFLLKLPEEKFHALTVALLHVNEAEQALDHQCNYAYALEYFKDRAKQFTPEKEAKMYDPTFFERVFNDRLYEAVN